MSTYEQNPVSRAVWPWASREESVPTKAGLPRQVRTLIQVVIMGLISLLLYKWEHFTMMKIVLTLAAIVLVSGLFIPALFAKFEQFGQWLGKVVAVGLTWGLLTPFFYLCFTPGRIFLGLRGKDPLHRACPTQEPTYWIKRPSVRNLDQYKKQH